MTITMEQTQNFAAHLRARERDADVIEKYLRDVRVFAVWLGDRPLTGKKAGWRDRLLERGRASATVNSMISALNHFLKFLGHSSINTPHLPDDHRRGARPAAEKAGTGGVDGLGAARQAVHPGVRAGFVMLTKFVFCQFVARFQETTGKSKQRRA